MVGAIVAIGFISTSVWAHHMFTVGMTSISNIFFAFSTMLVGIPTGIKIFNWAATLYGGKIRFSTAMLFCVAFLFQFLVAGLTGIMLGVAPFDWQLTDSYFVVAHFHFTLVGGFVFGLFPGNLLLVPESVGPADEREIGQVALLAVLPGLQCHVYPATFPRLSWHAPSHLYLCARPWMGCLKHVVVPGSGFSGCGDPDLCMERDSLANAW